MGSSGQTPGQDCGQAGAQNPTPERSLRRADLRTSIRPTVAHVDLGAIRRNLGRLRQVVGAHVQLVAVIKADAYGHGAVPVARAIADACDHLAVSLVEEGFELRDEGIEKPTFVLGAFYAHCHADVLEADLTPVIYDRADLEAFIDAPRRRHPRRGLSGIVSSREETQRQSSLPAIHLKLDSGMSRLGFSSPGLTAAAARVQASGRLTLAGLCTHLATADGGDLASRALVQSQMHRFQDGLRRVRELSCASVGGQGTLMNHVSNSATAVCYPDARLDAVRPGLSIYGVLPSTAVEAAWPKTVSPLEPALSLTTRIMTLRTIGPGTSVSYGARFVADRETRVATLPVGYADGYPRSVAGGTFWFGAVRQKFWGWSVWT